jgi:hypothetical protein
VGCSDAVIEMRWLVSASRLSPISPMPRSMYLRTVFGSRPVRRAIDGHGSLAVKNRRIQDHHEFSELDHRRPHPNQDRTEWCLCRKIIRT